MAMRSSYLAATMRAIDREAASAMGISSFALMQCAGRKVAQILLQRFTLVDRFLILCGPGNNGGDGYVIASALLAAKRQVQVVEVLPASSPDCQHAKREFEAIGGSAMPLLDLHDQVLNRAELIVDAIFGIGARAIEFNIANAPLLRLIERVNSLQRPLVAVDLPSGLNSDTGAGAAIISSTHTITLLGQKPGLHTGKARAFCGEILFDSLSFTAKQDADVYLQDALEFLPRARSPVAHKGHFGHVCLMGGRLGTRGAIQLGALAALRSGAGLVSVMTDDLTRDNLAHWPEIMQFSALALPARCNVIAIGPGLGTDAVASELLQSALAMARERKISVVLDADALNLLASNPIQLPLNCVLTPHPLEAARLLGCELAQVEASRIDCAMSLAKKFGVTVVLKGAGTITAQADATPVICTRGNAGMASGGMGDVLTGVIAAFIAQGMSCWQGACDGVMAHALAGDQAASAGARGMIASDVIAALRGVVNPG
jgi:ADP-dependent NAD(P)H-hydrate dehydratase / NAD(P)H-hydrate epimerase